MRVLPDKHAVHGTEHGAGQAGIFLLKAQVFKFNARSTVAHVYQLVSTCGDTSVIHTIL